MHDATHSMDEPNFALTPEQRARLAQGMEDACVAVVVAPTGCTPDALSAAWAGLPLRHDMLTMATGPVSGFRGLRHLPAAAPCVLPWLAITVPEPDDLDAAAAQVADAGLPAQARDAGANACAVWLSHASQPPSEGRLVIIARAWLFDEASVVRLCVDTIAGALDAAALEDAPLGYEDFAAWRDTLVEGDEGVQGAAYWRRYLDEGGTPREGVRLPARRGGEGAPGATDQDDDAGLAVRPAGRVRWHVDAALAQGVVALAQACNIAPTLLPQVVWWALLARIGGATTIDGTLCHDCRDDYGPLTGSLGVFERCLPIRLRCDDGAGITDLACRLNEIVDEHRQWQESAPAALDAHACAALRGLVWPLSAAKARLVGVHAPLGHAELRLELVSDARGAILQAALAHGPHYDPASMTVLLDQFATMFSALAQQPELARQPWRDVPLISASERARRLAWAGPSLDIGDATVVTALRHHAQTTPDAHALEGVDAPCSWASLHAQVEAFAAKLQALGVQSGDVVALAIPRSTALVIALLGVMRAGSAYLPIDPAWPSARVAKVLTLAGPRLLIGENRPAQDFAGALTTPFVTLQALVASEAASGSMPLPSPDATAYLIFTSGSTGTPKGVPITHRQLANYAFGVANALGLQASHRIALTSSVAADLGNTALFGALAAGACLVVASDAEMGDGGAFARFVAESAIDLVKITPSHLEALVQVAAPRLPARVVLGGEAAPASLAVQLQRIRPGVRLFNHYGPTETTVGVIVHEHLPEVPMQANSLPLTQPLANNRLCVLDEALALAPAGACGALYIGGAQLMNGYLGREGRDGFIDDPHRPGERLYRTGDLARYLPDGGVQWMGRADEQVKIRGYRVEPAEIEAVCRSVPGVTQVAVRPWGSGAQTSLAAYVVMPAGTGDGAEPVRTALMQALPAAWVPTFIRVLSELPRLANGKVDRQALPDPRADGNTGALEVPPDSPLEAWLAKRLAELLGRDRVCVERTLFELGGDSLTVIRYVARIGEGLRVEVLPGQVFAHPGVRALATALLAAASDAPALQRRAQARLSFEAMTPEQQAALRERARHAIGATP